MGKLYKGSTLIKKVYKGGTAIKKIYKGSTLLWQADPYPVGTVKINLTAATNEQTIYLEEGIYKIEAVGSGSGGNGVYISAVGIIYYGAGGSGAAFVGNFYLPAGNYRYALGGPGGTNGVAGGAAYILNTSNNLGVSAGGGQGGSYTKYDGNSGGILSIYDAWISGTPQIRSNGNQGTRGGASYNPWPGGASLYASKGAGGSSNGAGGIGMLKVTYSGQ